MATTMIGQAIGIFGVAITIIVGVTFPLFPRIDRRILWSGLALGVLLLGTAGALLLIPSGEAQSSFVNQGPGSAYSYGQSGGITAGTINVAPSRAAFTSELGAQMLAHMPTKKPVLLRSIGGSDDQRIGDEVQKFLQNNGFIVKRSEIGILSPPPDHPFMLSNEPKEYVITVAPNTR